MMTEDEKYMARAIQLARMGEGFTSPNPMVGAVIVENGEIIGEGFHATCGQAHAEVNAINSVKEKDTHRLANATIYVSLEPCSHYGKTPPCALLLIQKKIKRVVIGMKDPFPKVNGGGIKMLREAGIEVTTGVMEDECRKLNKRFITSHRLKRPFIQLKWAETADGYIAAMNESGSVPVVISNPLSLVMMHRERSKADAIMVGTNTALADNPSLTCRLFPGRDPLKITFDLHGRLPQELQMREGKSIIVTEPEDLMQLMSDLYSRYNITSLMVEGGAKLLQSFIDADLYDEIRVERSALVLKDGLKSPVMPGNLKIEGSSVYGDNRVTVYSPRAERR